MAAFGYQKINDQQKAQIDSLDNLFSGLESRIKELPDGRYRALALNFLESSSMFANKAISKGESQ